MPYPEYEHPEDPDDATQDLTDDEEDLKLEQQWVNQHSWHVDGFADND